MNLTPGSIYSWEELCVRFVVNFASAYQRHGMEAHLHAVRQEPGETLRTFISRFTRVRGTIPRISDASIITAFHQGCVMKRCWRSWPRMTWKLSPRSLLWPTSAPGPLRAGHGTRHHRPGLPRRVAQVPSLRTAKRRKKNRGSERSPSAAPVVAAATGGRNKRNKHPRPQRGNSGSCPVHPNRRYNAMECREIIELAKRVSERREQTSKDGSPPRRRPGKERSTAAR
jgi:hypothetical protein